MFRCAPAILVLFLLFAAPFAAGCSCGDDDTGDDDLGDDDTGDDDMDDDDTDDDDVDEDMDDDDAVDDDSADDDTDPLDRGGLIPGPADPGHDAALELLAARYAQQFHGFMTVPFGMSLEAYISDPDMRAEIDDWLENSDLDETFEEYSGIHPFDNADAYGEHGDLGMFGGMASIGDVFRYALARDRGETFEIPIAELRQNVIELMDALHVCVEITGEPGVVVRGIRKIAEPGPLQTTEPLFDINGDPYPPNKDDNVWREDNSGAHPDFIWEDNTSKDQLDGYIFSMGAVWDIVADDPDIPQAKKDALIADAAAIGDMLMEVAPETGLDLSIRDADGRLTQFHDIHPRDMGSFVIPEFLGVGNGFNALMALGIVKTIAFITGEERFRDFFAEMIEDRGFLDYVDQTVFLTNNGPLTNWSNVNMMFVAIYPLLRYEADRDLRAYWQKVMADDLWGSRFSDWAVSNSHQAFFGLIWASFKNGATDDAEADTAAYDLAGFKTPPYWHAPKIVNCDDDELAAGECLAIDGTTIITLAGYTDTHGVFHAYPTHTGDPISTDPLPRTIRPPSNFDWRSPPYDVNGGGGVRLNPGGDFHGAYWLGRFMRRSNDTAINVSPRAW
ncbi:hypothetical protein K8I61_20450 [bacterium]|nr:hypothetical protein [bacterium]